MTEITDEVIKELFPRCTKWSYENKVLIVETPIKNHKYTIRADDLFDLKGVLAAKGAFRHTQYSATHLNGNVLCAVDVETAGLNWKKHDLLQVAVLPLHPDLKPSTQIPAFEIKLKPTRPWPEGDETAKLSKQKWMEYKANGVDYWEAADLFHTWFKDIQLPERKKLAILGCNFANFDKNFLIAWLGEYAYDFHFHQIRDIQQAALFLNDVADFERQYYPFPKTRLSYLCHRLGVINEVPHDALSDCIATAACYRELLRQPLRVFRVMPVGEDLTEIAQKLYEKQNELAIDYYQKESPTPWAELSDLQKKWLIKTVDNVLEYYHAKNTQTEIEALNSLDVADTESKP